MQAVNAEGLLRFTSHDIPAYAEEPLVLLAASLAASDFERPADPGWVAQGMIMMARAVALNATDTISVDYF